MLQGYTRYLAAISYGKLKMIIAFSTNHVLDLVQMGQDISWWNFWKF